MPGGSQNGVSNNPIGRTKGSKNEKSKQWEELGEAITGRHAQRFNDILEEWWLNDPDRFAQHYAGILKYFKPTKLQSDINIDQGINITFHNASKEFDFDKDGKSKKK